MNCFVSQEEMVLGHGSGEEIEWIHIKNLKVNDVIYDGMMKKTIVTSILERTDKEITEINYSCWFKGLWLSFSYPGPKLLTLSLPNIKGGLFSMKWEELTPKISQYLSLPNSIFHFLPENFDIFLGNCHLISNKFWGTFLGLMYIASLNKKDTLEIICPQYIFTVFEEDFRLIAIAREFSGGVKLSITDNSLLQLFNSINKEKKIPFKFWCHNKEFLSSLFNIIRIMMINNDRMLFNIQSFDMMYWILVNMGYIFIVELPYIIITGKQEDFVSGIINNIKNIFLSDEIIMKSIKTDSPNGIIINGIAII